MNVWTIVLMIIMVAVIAGVVIYFDYQDRHSQPSASERLGSGIGDVVTSIAQLAGGARL